MDLTKKWEGKETAYRMAFEEAPERAPGAAFVYSDINFVVLGALVERLSGESLDQYAAKHVFVPLGMKETRFLPPASWEARIAPTEEDEKHHLLRGVVHDPTARRMGGVAGNAGVFSTADDLAIFAQALLDGGRGVLSPATVAKMTAPQQPVNARCCADLGGTLILLFPVIVENCCRWAVTDIRGSRGLRCGLIRRRRPISCC